MTSRREARRIAIDVLYQADVTGRDPGGVLAEWRAAGRSVPPFSAELVEGVAERLPAIDLLLEEHSDEWSVARMAVVDRTILGWGSMSCAIVRTSLPPSRSARRWRRRRRCPRRARRGS